MNILLAQIIGMAGVTLMVFSIQFTKKKHIMFTQIIANIFYAAQYAFLSAFTAGFTNIIASIRCTLIYIYEKRNKKISLIYPIIFTILIIVVGVLTADNLLSIIPILIAVSYNISSFFKNPKVLKVVFLCASIIWIFYNIQVNAYTALIGNLFELVSSSYALIKRK